MVKRPSGTDPRPVSKPSRSKGAAPAIAGQSRIDRLVELIDHCTAAKGAADELGEKLLSYLLAMAIQESRSAVRQDNNSPRV